MWVFFSTSLQEHTDTKGGNCVFKRPSGGGTQVVVVVVVVVIVPPIYILNRCIPSHFHIKSLFVFDLPAVLDLKNRPNHHALRFSHFSHNTLFVGLLFYIPARAHRHKGRKLRFQEAQRRRHTGSSGGTPPIYILNRCILSIYILNRYIFVFDLPAVLSFKNRPNHTTL